MQKGLPPHAPTPQNLYFSFIMLQKSFCLRLGLMRLVLPQTCMLQKSFCPKAGESKSSAFQAQH